MAAADWGWIFDRAKCDGGWRDASNPWNRSRRQHTDHSRDRRTPLDHLSKFSGNRNGQQEDYPEYLAVGFLRNQGMLNPSEVITGISYDDELETIVVRTETQTNYEEKLKKKTRTSGCAVGTVFGDMMEGLEDLKLPQSVKTSWLYTLASRINRTPSLYLEAGAIHGTVLCEQDRPLVYMEDVGRHNAVDKIAGWMMRNDVSGGIKSYIQVA